jgi:hypothetical protein
MTVTRDAPGAPPDAVSSKGLRQDAGQRKEALSAFRPRRVLPAVLAAVVLAALAVFAALDDVAAHEDPSAEVPRVSTLEHAGRTLRWDDPAALAIGSIAAALGLILIAIALWPGRGNIIPIASSDAITVTGITRRGLRRCLADAATLVEGIDAAKVRVGRRHARVVATSTVRDPYGLRGQVRDCVSAELDELALLRPLQVRVQVRRRKD